RRNVQLLFSVLEELPEKRELAKTHIAHAQAKQKRNYDRKIKNNTIICIGDLVLLAVSAPKNKPNPKYTGPYYVHAIPFPGVFKLRTKSGKLLATPINRALIKPYYERTMENVTGPTFS
ncbi:1754_t:CDS:1, partial [Gigaspora rosea]